MSYKSEINLANCNPNIYKSLERTACNTSRGGKKRRTQKGGNRCLLPKNPTPSSYWPAPANLAQSPQCQFPHFRPLVLSQFGGKKKKKTKRRNKKVTRRYRKYKK